MKDNENERDEQLIKEREEYEKEYFSQVIDDMIESDAFDKLIHDRFQYFEEHFDFEPSPEYQRLEELYYAEYESKFKETDTFDEIDYPEGPDENLEGIRYDGLYDDFDADFIDYEPILEEQYDEMPAEILLEEERLSNQIENYDPSDFYDDVMEDILINENDEDEGYLKDLIDEHLKDEKAFFDSMLIEAIQEEHYFEKAIDDLIMEQIDAQFEEYERSRLASQFEDYEVDYGEPYWYDSPFEDECYWDEDESVVDPFDSFDEIDYPEGEPQHIYYEPINYENEVPDDYSVSNFKYDGEMEFLEIENQEEKRNQELIREYEKIESLYKDYFTKDDTLDNIIKEKLKDKKFNI